MVINISFLWSKRPPTVVSHFSAVLPLIREAPVWYLVFLSVLGFGFAGNTGKNYHIRQLYMQEVLIKQLFITVVYKKRHPAISNFHRADIQHLLNTHKRLCLACLVQTHLPFNLKQQRKKPENKKWLQRTLESPPGGGGGGGWWGERTSARTR